MIEFDRLFLNRPEEPQKKPKRKLTSEEIEANNHALKTQKVVIYTMMIAGAVTYALHYMGCGSPGHHNNERKTDRVESIHRPNPNPSSIEEVTPGMYADPKTLKEIRKNLFPEVIHPVYKPEEFESDKKKGAVPL